MLSSEDRSREKDAQEKKYAGADHGVRRLCARVDWFDLIDWLAILVVVLSRI